MTTHDDICKKLSEYLDEALPQDERDAADLHLKECPECRQELAELRRTVEHVRSLEKIEPPPWLAGKIMTRVREEAPARKGLLSWLFFPLHVKIPLEALAVLIICFSGYFLATKTSREEPARLPGQPPALQVPAPPAETVSPKREEVSPPTPLPDSKTLPEARKAPQRQESPESSAPLPPPVTFAPPPPPPGAASRPARPAPPSLPDDSAKPWLEPLPEVPHSLKSKRAMPLAKPAERSENVAVAPQAGAAREADTAGEISAKAAVRHAIFVIRVPDPVQAVSAIEDIVEREKGRVLRVDMEESEVIMHVMSGPFGRDRIIAGLRSLGSVKEERPDEGGRFVVRVVKK